MLTLGEGGSRSFKVFSAAVENERDENMQNRKAVSSVNTLPDIVNLTDHDQGNMQYFV